MLNVARGSGGGVGSSVIGDDIHDEDVWYVIRTMIVPKGSTVRPSDLAPKNV
jgi:hypothetical protein